MYMHTQISKSEKSNFKIELHFKKQPPSAQI